MSVVVDFEEWESLRTRPPKAVMVEVVLKDMLLEVSGMVCCGFVRDIE